MSDYRGDETSERLEFNARIAEHVCGWKTIQYEEWPGSFVPMLWHESMGHPRGRDFNRLADGRWVSWYLPDFQGNMSDAWLVVEAMRQHGYRMTLDTWVSTGDAMASFYKPEDKHQPERHIVTTDDNAPLAICRSALRAVGAIVD